MRSWRDNFIKYLKTTSSPSIFFLSYFSIILHDSLFAPKTNFPINSWVFSLPELLILTLPSLKQMFIFLVEVPLHISSH